MSEKDWAEGSGSNWEDLHGDPRITEGAEVLVGRHREVNGDDNWGIGMAQFVGTRQTVSRRTPGHDLAGCRTVLLRQAPAYWRARDLVCLRAADGLLTEEGEMLQLLGRKAWGEEYPRQQTVSVMLNEAEPALPWALRVGVLHRSPFRQFPNLYEVDQEKLAQVLGRTRKEPKEEVIPIPEGADVERRVCGVPVPASAKMARVQRGEDGKDVVTFFGDSNQKIYTVALRQLVAAQALHSSEFAAVSITGSLKSEPAPAKTIPEEGGVFISGVGPQSVHGVRVYDRELTPEDVNAVYQWDAHLLPKLKAYFDAGLLTGTPDPVEVLRSLARCILTGTSDPESRRYWELWAIPGKPMAWGHDGFGADTWTRFLATRTFDPTPKVCRIARSELARLAGPGLRRTPPDTSGEELLRDLEGWLRRPCRSGR